MIGVLKGYREESLQSVGSSVGWLLVALPELFDVKRWRSERKPMVCHSFKVEDVK